MGLSEEACLKEATAEEVGLRAVQNCVARLRFGPRVAVGVCPTCVALSGCCNGGCPSRVLSSSQLLLLRRMRNGSVREGTGEVSEEALQEISWC